MSTLGERRWRRLGLNLPEAVRLVIEANRTLAEGPSVAVADHQATKEGDTSHHPVITQSSPCLETAEIGLPLRSLR